MAHEPLTSSQIEQDARMVALRARLEGERQQQEDHFQHRIDALEATIREEAHKAESGHYPIAGEGGRCAWQERLENGQVGSVCDALIHVSQAIGPS